MATYDLGGVVFHQPWAEILEEGMALMSPVLLREVR
jgi:hypothetical protein